MWQQSTSVIYEACHWEEKAMDKRWRLEEANRAEENTDSSSSFSSQWWQKKLLDLMIYHRSTAAQCCILAGDIWAGVRVTLLSAAWWLVVSVWSHVAWHGLFGGLFVFWSPCRYKVGIGLPHGADVESCATLWAFDLCILVFHWLFMVIGFDLASLSRKLRSALHV